MAVQKEATIDRFRGLSTDEKPGLSRTGEGDERKLVLPRVGSTFTETDTGKRYVWTGSWPWIRQEQTIEPLLEQLIELNQRTLDVLAATHAGHEDHLWERDVEIEHVA